jgi:hypothetical protein
MTKHGADLSPQIEGTINYAGLMSFVIRKHVDILCFLRVKDTWLMYLCIVGEESHKATERPRLLCISGQPS